MGSKNKFIEEKTFYDSFSEVISMDEIKLNLNNFYTNVTKAHFTILTVMFILQVILDLVLVGYQIIIQEIQI